MENNHVYSPAQAGLSYHIQSINALSEKLRRAEIKVEQYHVSIGRHIAAIKTARPDDWEDVVKTECNLGRSWAYELMTIADGSKTIEQTRDQANARKIKHRKSVRSGTDNVGEGPADSKGRKQPAHRTTSAPSEAKSHKIKFTPERIAQIKNLIERGMSRKEIAEIIGVTTGSLQSTCSRHGISLRRKATTTPTPPPPEDTRDDVGPASTSEVARPQSRVNELQAEKRRLEIENVGLRSEVQDAKTERRPKLPPDGETAFYCSFCDKSQHDVDTLITDGGRLKPVCICNECVDLCVNIIKDRSSAAHKEAAAPPVSGDYPDISESLRRAAP